MVSPANRLPFIASPSSGEHGDPDTCRMWQRACLQSRGLQGHPSKPGGGALTLRSSPVAPGPTSPCPMTIIIRYIQVPSQPCSRGIRHIHTVWPSHHHVYNSLIFSNSNCPMRCPLPIPPPAHGAHHLWAWLLHIYPSAVARHFSVNTMYYRLTHAGACWDSLLFEAE